MRAQNSRREFSLLKTRKKWISVLLTLVMLVGLMVPLAAPAMAATDNVALTVPAVPATANNVTLGTLRIAETEATVGSIAAGQQITINLPSGVSYVTAPTGPTLGNYIAVDGTGFVAADIGFVEGNTKSLTVSIASRADSTKKGWIAFKFDTAAFSQVNLSDASAEIAINIFAPNSGVTGGDVVVAVTESAGTKAAVMSGNTVAAGSNKNIGSIRIAENRSNSVKDSTGTKGQIKLVLPDGITWNAAMAVAGYPKYVNWTENAAPVIGTNSDGLSQYTITVNTTAAGTNPGFLNMDLSVDVDDKAFSGPIKVKISGDNVTSETIEVGKVADYSVKVTGEEKLKTVKAGAIGQAISKIFIEEGLGSSLIGGRDFSLILPSYAHWDTSPTVSRDKGNAIIAADQAGINTVDDKRQELSYSVTAGTSKTKYTLKDAKIFLDADAPEGDLVVTVKGKALGDTFEVPVAKVVKPVKVEADKADVVIGRADQEAGKITITETAAGNLKVSVNQLLWPYNKSTRALRAGGPFATSLVLVTPAGVKFKGIPTVKVTSGDLKIKASDVEVNNAGDLVIPIDKASSEVSTIEISDIKYTVDRTVPEGDIELDVTGNALDQVEDVTWGNCDDAVVKVANATTITPAPGETMQAAAFVIGSTTYTANGVENTMDVAPYVTAAGRTYVPIRYLAYALGISEENVFWDEATRTVTLLKGTTAVQLTIGSNVIKVNGISLNMDVAPEIKDGRTMLPARFVAQAFGASVGYDEASQTVTIEM